MLVEILSNDNGSGCNTTLNVHKCYNRKFKLFEQKPLCKIEQDDFFDLLPDPEKAFDKAVEGKIHFDVNINDLIDKAKTVY